MIDKNDFVQKAQSLPNSYKDYGCCVYSIAYKNNIIAEVYDYIQNKAKSVDDLDMYMYKLLGNPQPYTVINKAKQTAAVSLT